MMNEMDRREIESLLAQFEKIIRGRVGTSRITKTREEAEAFVEATPITARYSESTLYKLIDFIYEGTEATWDEWYEE